ncbi:MAG: hypothetical protein Kow0083_11640 [Methylophaga sp.]|jgi:hypothetical protein
MSNSVKNQSAWQRECLLAANRQLEKIYRGRPSACIALQISRNYRLLLTHYEQPDIKRLWQLLSKRWWSLYCRDKQIPGYSLPDFSAVSTKELT